MSEVPARRLVILNGISDKQTSYTDEEDLNKSKTRNGKTQSFYTVACDVFLKKSVC